MRIPLPPQPLNGGASELDRVFVISGTVARPTFRLSPALWPEGVSRLNLAVLCLGAPELGAPAHPPTPTAGLPEEADPYFVLRRASDGGQVIAAARLDWEGIFTVLANDDEAAEQLFRELIAPAGPEEVLREWSQDRSTIEMFAELLRLN